MSKGWREADPRVVAIVMVTVAVIWLSEAGLKLQLAPAGKPLQAKEIRPEPVAASTVKSRDVELPAMTVRLFPWEVI